MMEKLYGGIHRMKHMMRIINLHMIKHYTEGDIVISNMLIQLLHKEKKVFVQTCQFHALLIYKKKYL